MANSGLKFKHLMNALNKLRGEDIIRFDFGYFVPNGFHSYRGWYEDMALGYVEPERDEEFTVKEFKQLLAKAYGKTIEGYKGGTYHIHNDTYVWVSRDSSQLTGTTITNIKDLGYGYAIIETAYED